MDTQKPSRSLTLAQLNLNKKQRDIVNAPTPQEFIKTRQGKKGKQFTYVEGGYVIAKLNQAFSPLGWDFEVVEQEVIENPKEVWVKGKLTIKDHRGHQVSKTQYGTKEWRDGIPLGDTLKAAATDCLKKCASMLGIALDVYWQQLDLAEKVAPEKGESKTAIKPLDDDARYKDSMEMIKAETDPQILVEWYRKITQSTLGNPKQRLHLLEMIEAKIHGKGKKA